MNRARGIRHLAVCIVAIVLGVVVVPGPASASVRQQQWHLDALNIAAAQQMTTGQGVTVAVIDSGVDNKNPDLEGQVRLDGTSLGAAGQAGQKPTEDFEGHGTSMAGLIAAKGGDPDHALGIAPGARILPINIDTTHIDQYVAENETAQGIHYAVDHGASVINASQGSGRPPSSQMQQAIGYALAHNVVVVAAAGNTTQGDSSVDDIARIPGVVAVTGSGQAGTFWSGSVQGAEAGVAAPAENITSTDSTMKTDKPNSSNYETASGTSDSTAIVSGVVALIRAKYPKLDAVNVINRLVRTADDKGPAGRDPQYGFGVVNPVKALTAEVPSTTANPLGTPPSPAPLSASASASKGGQAATGGSDDGSSGSATGAIVIVVLVLVLLILAVVALLVMRRSRRPDEGSRRSGTGVDGD